jgi:probable F420-dependent oxidoreductase
MYGLALPGRGPFAKPDVLLKLAEKAEALRFTSLWVTDHVVLPVSDARSTYPYAPTGHLPGGMNQDYLDPFALLGVLAHATRRIRLGTSVLVVPYRNPVVTAKMLASLDVVSNGRMILGAGVGWLREEFEALGAPPFEDRGRVTDEYLKIMRTCWTTAPASYEGRYYRFAPVYALPQPRQPGGIPIWIGGHTEAALRRVATIGDGWHPIAMRPPAILAPDEYGGMARQIHSMASAAGRDPKSITLSVRAPLYVAPKKGGGASATAGARGASATAGARPMFQGTAAEVVADIRAYREQGVSDMIFDAATPATPDLRSVLANLDRFAEDVRPKLR